MRALNKVILGSKKGEIVFKLPPKPDGLELDFISDVFEREGSYTGEHKVRDSPYLLDKH